MGANASKYDKAPWEPNVDSGSSDSADEQKAADDYTNVYGGSATHNPDGGGDSGNSLSLAATMPELSMAYTTAPDFVPSVVDSSSDGKTPAEDFVSFTVQLASLRTCEQSVLNSLGQIEAQYETLKTTVNNAISDPSLFGQKNGAFIPGGRAGAYWQADALDQEGVQFAASIGPQMAQVLQSVAGGIESIGIFAALLNNAGQSYTEADSKSAMQEPAT